MTNLINFGRAKKQRTRAEKRTKGDQNAARFGQSKAEDQLQSDLTKHHNTLLDQHKLDVDE